ncbi:MAG TPA: archease [Thermodesulfobacteriota bacterium]|nr:archease [Thermodesulfobacteriota bacterium]
MPYEFLEDIAIADIAFRAWGKNLEETFIAASDATMNVMVENLDSIQPVERRKLQLQNEALDMLLFDLLQELIYYKDTKKLMLRIHQIQITKEDGQHTLKAVALGSKTALFVLFISYRVILSKRKIYDRQNIERILASINIYQSDLQTFQTACVIHKPQLESFHLTRIIKKS